MKMPDIISVKCVAQYLESAQVVVAIIIKE